jgi:hypothetical protein
VIDALQLRAILVTGRELLLDPLTPNIIVRCDFGRWKLETMNDER